MTSGSEAGAFSLPISLSFSHLAVLLLCKWSSYCTSFLCIGGGASGPACWRRVKSERKTRKSGYSTSQDRKTLLCIFLSSALPCVLSSPLLGVSARRFLFLHARSQQVRLRGHEQVSRKSRREKGRGVGRKQQTRATAGDGAPRAEATRRVKSIGGLLTKIWVSGLRFLLSAGPSPSILLSRLWLR